jgi:hypothetical protein
LWQRITSIDTAWNKFANWAALPCFSAILSVPPASRAARFAKSSIGTDASSNVKTKSRQAHRDGAGTALKI